MAHFSTLQPTFVGHDPNAMSIISNKKAFHDYFIEEKFEAGLALEGWEVKSIRAGRANIKESYILIRGGELFIFGMHISPYEKGNIFNKDPLRVRKLLLHWEILWRTIKFIDGIRQKRSKNYQIPVRHKLIQKDGSKISFSFILKFLKNGHCSTPS